MNMKKIGLAVLAVLAVALVALIVTGGVWQWQYMQNTPTNQTDETTWAASLTVAPVESTSVGEETLYSSGELLVTWEEPKDSAVDHYEIQATDAVMGESTEAVVEKTTEAKLTGLKSETSYTINLTACLDASCKNTLLADTPASQSTSTEYWQIQGTGHDYDSATKVTSTGMGSTLAYVLPYGDWAPKSLQNIVKVYSTGHTDSYGLGMHIGINDSGEEDIVSLSSFEDIGYFYEKDCHNSTKESTQTKGSPTDGMPPCPADALQMLAFQMVPLTNESVRVYFEAETEVSEQKSSVSIYSWDSTDGYVAEDFNPSTKSHCSSTDMVEGGDCEPTPLIGTAKDGVKSLLTQARQQKIGYPKQDSWLWDESEGTFMVITGEDACGQTRDGLFYGVWSGKVWDVITGEDGCAKPLVLDAHGPVIVHLGGANYKLYYENYEYTTRKDAAIVQYDVKPTRVLYASGAQTGDESIVDFEDWENEEDARDVNFLWPDGTPLNDQEEAGLGDHVIWSPNEDLQTQIMYMNLGGMDDKDWLQASAGLGMAVLMNP